MCQGNPICDDGFPKETQIFQVISSPDLDIWAFKMICNVTFSSGVEYVTKVGQNKSWTLFVKKVYAS